MNLAVSWHRMGSCRSKGQMGFAGNRIVHGGVACRQMPLSWLQIPISVPVVVEFSFQHLGTADSVL